MPNILVLCYHAVSPSWRADLSVTPDRLERQLHRLLSHGYRGATIKALAHACGLSPASLYHYFGSKRELYLDVVRELLAEAPSFVGAEPSEWVTRVRSGP